MSNQKKLSDYREEIKNCVKCGTCRAHCPVFAECKREPIVARGKLALADAVLAGEAGLDPKVVEDMSMCLLCGSCYDKCPNLVKTDEVVMAARRAISEQHGKPLFAKGVGMTLGNPGLMKTMAGIGQKFSWLLFKEVPEKSGLRLRFPLPFIEQDRTLPPLAAKPFRDRHSEFIPGKEGMPTVSFFTGCSINYFYPEIGEATLKALKFLGCSIIIPKDQACCGMPAHSAGDGPTVDYLAETNLQALSKRNPDYIITACATCKSGIGKYYKGLSDDHDAMAKKVIDIHQFLVQQGFDEKLAALPKQENRVRVTYHDPCHLRTEKITAEPRRILKALPSVEFVEMEGADRCCGLGGTFSVYHYDASKKIGARKAPGIEKSGAELVASACPGCLMQLQDTINHADLPQKTIHIMELVARDLPALEQQK